MKKYLSRIKRTAQRTIAVALMSTGLGCSQYLQFQNNPSSSVNKGENYSQVFFDKFPENIPQACEVRKYPRPDAQRTLVHILQQHFGNNQSALDLAKTISVQNDIYAIVKYLSDQRIIKKVYLEGVTPKQAEEIILYKNELSHLRTRGSIYGAERAFLEDIVEIAGSEKKEDHDQGLKVIRDLENLEKKGIQAIDEGKSVTPIIEEIRAYLKDPETIKLLCDNREDGVLKIFRTNKEINPIIIFGAAHAWGGTKSCGPYYPLTNRLSMKDNIQYWNSRHPKEKYALIEVIPQRLSHFKQN